MRQKIKLAFVDFWGGFNFNNNFFYHTLSTFLDVEISEPESADVIIFTCYGRDSYSRGNKYTNSTKYPGKTKIFFTGENLRPDYENLDYSFSFDFDENGKNIRMPLWMIYIDWFGIVNYDNPKFTIPYSMIEDNEYKRKEKTKFCSIVFNHQSPYRVEFIQELSKYKKVDVFGGVFGNIGYGEDEKLKVISDYKFNICFENSIHPGYYTEKPLHAKIAGCVPIYWSDKNMSRDFNDKAFINLYDFDNDVSKLAQRIIELDQDDQLFEEIRREPLFLSNQDPKKRHDDFIDRLKNIFQK